MGRGGYRGNHSYMSDENAITATGNELAALTHNALETFNKSIDNPPIDLHDRNDVIKAIVGYFKDCEIACKRPGNLGLYRALGMSRQDWNNIITGKSKSKASPDCIDVIKKACLIISEYREQLCAQGKLNPVTAIFWQKNYDGLSDVTTLEINADTRQEARLSPEQIAKQIEQDIPIDVDYTDN